MEKARAPFEVLQPEEARTAEMGGIRARVRIDRIDRLDDGRQIIIDYKTGEANPSAWETGRPDEPQVPLYGAIHEGPLAGVLYGQLKTGEMRFRGWTDGPNMVPGARTADLAAMTEEWRAVLERLAGEFRAGHAEADPKNPAKSCRHCVLAGLCRIAETGALAGEDDSDGSGEPCGGTAGREVDEP